MITLNRLQRLLALTLALAASAVLCPSLHADNIVFPSEAGAINVKTAYGAKGDGKTDDTAAIQKAIDGTKGKPSTLYFPDGTYLLSDRVGMVGGKAHGKDRFVVFQGQSEKGTILKLKDNCPGFQDATKPKEVFSMHNGQSTGDAMRGYFNDFTVDTGKGNPGASGVRYFTNNTGGMRNVTIRSSDPKLVGGIGLDLTQSQNGPGFIKSVTVIGFDTGIALDNAFAMTFEHIRLANQNKVGFVCTQRVAMRDLISINRVPAVNISTGYATLALIDSELKGGSATEAAILKTGGLYLRNVKQSGYGAMVKDGKGQMILDKPAVTEWVQKDIGAFGGKKGEGLLLPVKETPEVPWETDPTKWELIPKGANTAAVQAAFDNAARGKKTTVAFPPGEDVVKIDGPIRVTGSVNRIVGMESLLPVSDPSGVFESGKKAVFTFENLTGPGIVVERFFKLGGWKGKRFIHMFENKTSKPLILRNLDINSTIRIPGGGGELYLEDVGGTPLKIGKGESAWLRQYNPESSTVDMLQVDGGTVWLLGLKTEGRATHVTATNGAKVEVLGGASYQSWGGQKLDPPMFKAANSDVFFSIGFYETDGARAFSTVAEQTNAGKTETLHKDKRSGNFRIYSK
jgi:Pectate lyase superfamily protein